jgi:CRP/FNR family cyclic AMP-dependent transcriptional regulator
MVSIYSSTLNTPAEAANFVGRFPLFNNLDMEQRAKVASRILRRSFASGVILFHQDMPSNKILYMIDSGWVRIFSLGHTGQELTHSIRGGGDILGEIAALDNGNHLATALTITQTVLWMLPGPDLEELLNCYSSLGRALIEMLVYRMRSASLHTDSLVFENIPGRLAYNILYLADNHGEKKGDAVEIYFPLTQGELASFVGASRESVNKAIATLRSKNLIALKGHKICVLDFEGLKRIVNEQGR